MLLATQSQSVIGTQKYFEQVLTQGDYYVGQEVAGHWHGKGADVLGLGQGSAVTKEQFVRMLKGYHPVTGAKLTQRIRKDRRPGTDLTFSVPKSVSLAWTICDDDQIIEALRQATRETMAHDVEPLMERRVRQGKFAFTQQKARTGRLIYADFLHKTSRPVEGRPDPHLHIHAFVMNWTEEGGKHFAGEMEEIVRQRPCLQAKFEARLARKIEALGYGVEHVQFMQSGRLKRGWEIQGVERSTIEKFSRRTEQIEAHAERHGIQDAAEKGRLGKTTREAKDGEKPIEQLRTTWRRELTPEERSAFESLKSQKGSSTSQEESEAARASKSVKYALDHHLYRQSTIERHVLEATALEHGLTIRPDSVREAVNRMDLIRRQVNMNGGQRELITTRDVLNAERRMIRYARDERGTRKAIGKGEHAFKRDWLNDHQKEAVRHILKSRDTVMAILGAAGTGKTSLKQEAVEAVRQNGKEVFSFAPSTGATEVLQNKGFKNATTVEHLIRNTRLHQKLQDQVLWIDEAGLLDVRSMNAVFEIAKQKNARVILSGDTRQHSSPRRGEAMRLLENEAGLKIARVEKIQRQKARYRQVVKLIGKGHEPVQADGKSGLEAGFDLLGAMGKIKEISDEDRNAKLAETYAGAIGKGKSALVVSPTHAEAKAVTAEIRTLLREQGTLSPKEKAFTRYRALNLSEAERSEPRTYANQESIVIQFHQNCQGGIKRGDRFKIAGIEGENVMLTSLAGGQRRQLPLGQAGRFEVYVKETLKLASGDKIRFSLGGRTKDDKSRISNGRLDEIKGFDRQGNIILKNGWKVSKDYAHFDLGYVVTSHASQGKDCDIAIAAMSSDSLPAINAKQFYVTVSRGKEDVALFVDSKQRIAKAIQNSGEQLSATEMLKSTAQSRPAKQQEQCRRKTNSFGERIKSWWRNLREERDVLAPTGRIRGLESPMSGGFGSGAPSPQGGLS